MKKGFLPRLLLSVTACLSLIAGDRALTQELETSRSDAPTGSATSLVERNAAKITAAITEREKIEPMLATASPAIRQLLQRRMDDKEALIYEAVNDSAIALLRMQERGEDISDYRDQAIEWMQMLVPMIMAFHDRSNAVIEAQLSSTNRDQTADASAAAIEINGAVERNVEAYKALHRMLTNLAGFGVDVTDLREDLRNEVYEAAEMLTVAIELESDDVRNLRYRLTMSPDDPDLKIDIRITELKRQGFARSLGALSDIMQELDINPAEYRSLVLLVTGDVATRILDRGVMGSLAQQWSKTAWTWLHDNGVTLLFKTALFLLILLGFRALSRLTKRVAEKAFMKVEMSHLLRGMMVSWTGNAVMILGVLIALSQVGVTIGPVLAGLGVAGFIVGFALQDTLGNFASGMMILIYRPYDVGDTVEAGGIMGKVKDMSLVYTLILTFDNQKMIVPNNKIWGDVIRNYTSQRVRRVDLVFGISYEDDIQKAENVLTEIVKDHELTLDEPEPSIKVHTLNESSVDFIVRPWVRSADYWDVYWDLTKEVKLRFDKEGISIPFPQRDIHHYHEQAPEASGT